MTIGVENVKAVSGDVKELLEWTEYQEAMDDYYESTGAYSENEGVDQGDQDYYEHLAELGSKKAIHDLYDATDSYSYYLDHTSDEKLRPFHSVHILDEIVTEESVDELIEGLVNWEKSWQTRVAMNLIEIAGEKAVADLIAVWDAANSRVRERLQKLLEPTDSEPAIESLQTALKDTNCYARWYAVGAIGHFHDWWKECRA